MKNLVLMFCCALALVGCGTKVGAPLEIRPNVYTVDIERMQAFLSGAQMDAKRDAIQIAKDFCAKKGKQAHIQSMETQPTQDGATASIVFECAEGQDGA